MSGCCSQVNTEINHHNFHSISKYFKNTLQKSNFNPPPLSSTSHYQHQLIPSIPPVAGSRPGQAEPACLSESRSLWGVFWLIWKDPLWVYHMWFGASCVRTAKSSPEPRADGDPASTSKSLWVKEDRGHTLHEWTWPWPPLLLFILSFLC